MYASTGDEASKNKYSLSFSVFLDKVCSRGYAIRVHPKTARVMPRRA
jgi:hypothetical protein